MMSSNPSLGIKNEMAQISKNSANIKQSIFSSKQSMPNLKASGFQKAREPLKARL